MKEAFLVFPHQLFEKIPVRPDRAVFCLFEDPLFFTQYRFHRKKLIFHRASMKAYASWLESRGARVLYHEAVTFSPREKILEGLSGRGFGLIHYYDPVDDWLEKKIIRTAEKLKIPLQKHRSPAFLNAREDLTDFFSNRKKFLMESFYIRERRRLGILVRDGKPEGGRWSFDAENRKKLPSGIQIPAVRKPSGNAFVREAAGYVEKNFPHHYGDTDDFFYPVTFSGARTWLRDFLENRLRLFGNYEDAMHPDEPFLFHSVLSPLLNSGLLTPEETVKTALEAARRNSVPLNSLEGFLRQVIGWREFIRGVYEFAGRRQRTSNFWGHHRKMPESFWTGQTGILPVDQAIRKTLRLGYAHHIERLMILGNFMLLCEFHPDEVYEWFMTLFIDSYDWVMVPNVYGMSQFADGGLMATKPYLSASNYLLKMGVFPKGAWCEVWTALYWRFIRRHRDFFTNHPRLGMMARLLAQMPPAKLSEYEKTAERFLEKGLLNP